MLKFYIAYYGDKIGLTMILMVWLYDPLMIGLRGFYEWNIGIKGFIFASLGGLLIALSKWCKETI